MSEDLKAVARQVIEIFNTGNLDLADDVIADDYVGHDPTSPEPLQGRDAFKAQVALYRGAFSDLELTIDDELAEGDRVVTRWTGRGTHDGELFGISATGNTTTVTGISISRIADGKIVEDWSNWDALGLMQQLGAVPAMA
jgi:steroid delta-isomerase-like uncharacterized protein